jgi:SAM-dependent methyltransferase
MAHPEQMQFVEETKTLHPEFFTGGGVLEIGSLNINGSVRSLFSDCFYTGIDVVPGPGVDLVTPAHSYACPDGIFDVVISCECFEHDPHWMATLNQAVNVLRTGGLFIFTCASGNRQEHGTRRTTPGDSGSSALEGWGDYYRNLSPEDIRSAIDVDRIFPGHVLRVVRFDQDMQFRGIKA